MFREIFLEIQFFSRTPRLRANNRPMDLVIGRTEIFLNEVQTRMPFKYGIATVLKAPQVFVRITLSDGTASATGLASDLLPPKWFTKIPEKALEVEIAEMLEVIRNACGIAEGLGGKSVFEIWKQLYQKQHSWGETKGYPPL